MEVVLELLVEAIFQLFFEGIWISAEGSKGMGGKIVRYSSKLFFYLLIGACLGAISYAVWPYPLLTNTPNTIISIIFVPAAVALVTVAVTRWIERKYDWETNLEQFSLSLFFAMSFALIRYFLIVGI